MPTVSVSEFEGKPILKIEKEGLTAMANAAFRDVSFLLRRSHNEQVAKILSDPEASDNDKYVALTFLRNAEVSAKGKLPLCQDTGTAIIHGEKGQQVWTGYCDEEALSLGVYKTYTEENLRYSQNAPLNMYDEVNTKCNLPAQIDLEATEGMEYKFLCVTKGGGSANKTLRSSSRGFTHQRTNARSYLNLRLRGNNMALTESQHKAINRYRSKNKAQVQYINRRSVAKNFILKDATQEDLDMLLDCIKQRQEKLND